MVVRNDNEGTGPEVIPWDANGSRAVLQNLLKSRIPQRMVLLEQVRDAFNASWRSDDGTSPHLGSGGFGDVYRVEVEGIIQALKVVRKGHARAEFDTLQQAFNDQAPVVEVLVEKHNDQFAAYTMKPVGTPWSYNSREDVSRLFTSLYTLHSKGWYHGDPRWQIAIVFDGNVLWCDFLEAKKLETCTTYYRACDLQKLVESLVSRSGHTIPTVSELEEKLSFNPESYDDIATLVLNAMEKG